MKPVVLQDSLIFKIHILLNLEILFLEAYRFQNPEGLAGSKEYTQSNPQVQLPVSQCSSCCLKLFPHSTTRTFCNMLRYQRHLATSVTTFDFSRRTAFKKCRVANTSIENRRCSRHFKPRSKVFGKHLKFFLPSMLNLYVWQGVWFPRQTLLDRQVLFVSVQKQLFAFHKQTLFVKYMFLWRSN